MLTDRVKLEIRQDAQKRSNIECCGLILFNKEYFIYPAENVAIDKEQHFSIKTKDFIYAKARGTVIGTYHSHINEQFNFTEDDISSVEVWEMPNILYLLKTDEFKTYYPKGYINPYIGRFFEYGRTDCYELVREYYQKELNIELSHYNRDDNWDETIPYVFEENYAKEGFFQVDELKKHDCILMKYRETDIAGHVMIYLGNDIVLHHPWNRFSLIESYSNFYKRKTKLKLRHKSL
jgi:proteasome lid subunit RPN8/RPN11